MTISAGQGFGPKLQYGGGFSVDFFFPLLDWLGLDASIDGFTVAPSDISGGFLYRGYSGGALAVMAAGEWVLVSSPALGLVRIGGGAGVCRRPSHLLVHHARLLLSRTARGRAPRLGADRAAPFRLPALSPPAACSSVATSTTLSPRGSASACCTGSGRTNEAQISASGLLRRWPSRWAPARCSTTRAMVVAQVRAGVRSDDVHDEPSTHAPNLPVSSPWTRAQFPPLLTSNGYTVSSRWVDVSGLCLERRRAATGPRAIGTPVATSSDGSTYIGRRRGRRTLPRRKANILADIQALSGTIGPNDVLVVYFSGHGTQDTSVSLLRASTSIPYGVRHADARSDSNFYDYPAPSVRDDELAAAFAAIKTPRKVLILDTCNSGGFIGNQARGGLDATAIPRAAARRRPRNPGPGDLQLCLDAVIAHGAVSRMAPRSCPRPAGMSPCYED